MPDERTVEAFLTAYGDSLARYDAAATAELWGMPGTMVADGHVGVIADRAVMAEGLAQGYPLYRRLGLASVGHTVVEHVALTDRISRVRVRWSFRDAAGEEMTDASYEYTLHADDDAVRAYVAVSIDSEEKLAELVRRHGLEPGPPPSTEASD